MTNEYRLPPTANLLRLLIQQSNCFMTVERSAAGMNAMNRERSLQQSGEIRGGSNFGWGQMVSSDYGMSPEIVFSQDNTGGMGAALGGLIGGAAGAGLGGYSNTPQGKVVSAAFMDAYNQMVVALRSYKAQSVSGQGPWRRWPAWHRRRCRALADFSAKIWRIRQQHQEKAITASAPFLPKRPPKQVAVLHGAVPKL